MRLLLVEDDLILQDGLERAFSKSGYALDVMSAGDSADQLLSYQADDVIVLDLGLPKLNGFEVLKNLRARGNKTPVLILTVIEDIQNRVKGLDLGADDYLAKPFELAELEARLRDLISRRLPTDMQPLAEHDAPQELQPVLHALNDLLVKVKAAVDARHQFIANAAHQLKTPLSVKLPVSI